MFILLASAAAMAAAPLPPRGEVAVYIQRTGKSSINVLKLYPDRTYNYCRYTKTRIGRDSGRYRVKGRKLTLKTVLRRHGSNPFLEDAAFVGETGLYTGRMPMVFSGKPAFVPGDDPKYAGAWTFNPITGTWFDQGVTGQAAGKAEPVSEESIRSRNVLATDAARRFYMNTTAGMAPEYLQVLQKAYCGPGCYSTIINGAAVPWNGDTSANALIGDIETVIHESVHHFNGYHDYMVIPGLVISIPRTEVFRSADFGSLVPAGLDKKIFRYKTYVSDGAEVSSNVSGIYGLMDEFTAYMNGTKFSLTSARTALKQGDTTLARWYMGKAAQTYFAWHEFRLFTAWYLQYAEMYRKSVYNELMANKSLRVFFTLVDDEFAATISGLQTLRVGKGTPWAGISASYEQLYASPCYTELDKQKGRLERFRLKDVNKGNYQGFLNAPKPD